MKASKNFHDTYAKLPIAPQLSVIKTIRLDYVPCTKKITTYGQG
jgi:hypothetical protein